MILFRFSALFATSMILVGCQTTPIIQAEPVLPKATIPPESVQPESKVKVIPYPDSGIRTESQPLPSGSNSSASPPRVILPEQIPQPHRQLRDGRGIAAYQKAMQDYNQFLRQNNLVDAEKNLLQAQRIAPQSADVYRELARLANLRKQGSNAEAFARKGLSFAQTQVQRKQLWQQILLSAQIRQLPILIQQAQQQIARY